MYSINILHGLSTRIIVYCTYVLVLRECVSFGVDQKTEWVVEDDGWEGDQPWVSSNNG